MTKRRSRSSRKRILFKLCIPLYFVFCLFAMIWLKAGVVNLKYELGELDRMRTELVREKKMATAQRASFYSTEKIEGIAVKRLGMIAPVRQNVYYVKRTQDAGLFRASMK